ncbi:GAF domain-containing protein [Rhodoblastus sp.]|uniref:GAF domain-containing protein n=1 Tax=Rhodoblastus sp. TaxID=1962975 RepID=UPI003F9B4C3A
MTPENRSETIYNASIEIQPRGWMLVCDDQAARVLDHSNNLAELFPTRPGGFFGLALRDLVGSATAHLLRNGLSRASDAPRPILAPRQPMAGLPGLYDFAVHAAGELTIVEIEPAGEADPFALDRLRALIDRLASARGLNKKLTMAARLIQAMLQWDCVTILRLEPEGPRILARQKRLDWPDAEASAVLCADFPQQSAAEPGAAGLGAARPRFVADIAAAPVGLAGDSRPDLGMACLRAASRDEMSRARAAGFSALLALPIRVEGETWGVLLAHDRAARSLTMDERAVYDLFGDYLSLSIEAALAREAADEFRRRHAL